MSKTNNERLQEIVEAMGELNDRLVYVGGSMAELYASDSAAPEPRVTLDVDCVANTLSYREHSDFEKLLRAKHFTNDMSEDAPRCRWIYNEEKVDIVSTGDSTNNFGNRWYKPGFEKREKIILSSGKFLYRLPVVYYIATKIEALLSRGGKDWRGAKDFEDIVYVINYCPYFIKSFKKSDEDVQSYLSYHFSMMLKRPNITEEIECTVDEIERTDYIIETLNNVANYKPQKLRVQFVSDLHLEFPENRNFLAQHPLEVKGDILLIAGDTAYLDIPDSDEDTYSQYAFWDWASTHYQQVIVCFGNHDFYGHYDIATIPDGYCKQIRPNIHAYYNSVVHLGDVDVIVSTLWSQIEPFNAYQTEHSVNDFYHIKYQGHRLTADDFNLEHKRCLQFVKQAVDESKATYKIVLTHHVPTSECTAPEFRDSLINGAFTVELDNYIADSGIDYWIYGHSHRNIDAQIGNTHILSNQLGYVSHGEHIRNGFNSGKFIEI